MRGKRAKTYKKLMEKFSITFGFREPYQVLVDADMVATTKRFAMDLTPALERTLRGKVKPMITQCSMRHLYARNKEPGMPQLIEFAQTNIERRFCGHHPNDHPEPLSTLDCLTSIIDPKDKGENKHKYVVASQDQNVRRSLRRIPGVPLIYVNRSVMIMEPMTDMSETYREREERAKFRAEIKKSGLGKRKREEGEDVEMKDADNVDEDEDEDGEGATQRKQEAEPKQKKKRRGEKGPNPLSVKKQRKKKLEGDGGQRRKAVDPEVEAGEGPVKKKRKRKQKHKTADGGGGESVTVGAGEGAGEAAVKE